MSTTKPKTSVGPDKKKATVTVPLVAPEVCVTDASPKSPLIVVSNRLPFVLKRDPVTNDLQRKAR